MAKQTEQSGKCSKACKTRMDTDTVFQYFSCILSVSDFFGADQLVKEKRIYYEKSFCTSG